jgi:hypothetical protein
MKEYVVPGNDQMLVDLRQTGCETLLHEFLEQVVRLILIFILTPGFYLIV